VRLGIQTQTLNRKVVDFCLRAKVGVFKAIGPPPVDLLQELKAALPNCKFIYRPYFETQPLDNPIRRAQEAVDAAMSHLSQFPYDYTELYNETGLWDEAYDYITFTIEAAHLLAMAGQKLLAYSFAWGNPCGFVEEPYEDDPARWLDGLRRHWAPYCEGLRAVKAIGGGLALHQYRIPDQDDKFSILRHRLVRRVLPDDLKDIPIWLTEFGLDDKAYPASSGWSGSSWDWTPERYATWLIKTARAIGKEVAGATIFICGTPDWWSFDILGHPVIADAIAQVSEEEGGVIDIVDSLPRSRPPRQRSLDDIKYIVVHHAAAVTTPERTARYHVETKGWPTIGYHYFITEDGTIYYTARLGEITYHCGEHNPTSVGICLSGAFHGFNLPPTTAQQEALVELIDGLLGKLGLERDAIKAHHELTPTLCPGEAWFWDWLNGNYYPTEPSELEQLRQRVDELQDEVAQMQADIYSTVELIGAITEKLGKYS